MHSKARVRRHLWALSVIAAAGFSLPAAAVDPASPAGRFRPREARPGGPTEGNLRVRLSSKGGLPYPADAELWVDAQVGRTPVALGTFRGTVQKMQVVAFRPKGDALAVGEIEPLFVAARLLEASTKPVLELITPPAPLNPGGGAVAYDTLVYRTGRPSEILVCGTIRNPAMPQQLAYAVLMTSNLDAGQAFVHARRTVEPLVVEERARRLSVPAPAGAKVAQPRYSLAPEQIRQLLRGIEQDAAISPRVKEMARVLLPQATGLTFSAWRTQAPLSDQRFFNYYTQQAAALGWGAPVTRDETQPGRPTLLFQRPNSEAVVMVRAQPTTPRPGILHVPATTIYVLVMEGNINVGAVRGR